MTKLILPKISTEAEGVLKEKSFGVGNIGLIFDILRNKMYADPIFTVIREYACNARDANREVGKGEHPITVELPSEKNLYLKIFDNGPGISPNRMDEIFIMYGNSTKRNSNDYTGCYGLGSKSSWAYSDTFSIITTSNGVKRTYVAYIDESRAGKLILQAETPDFGGSGTTIIVPINKDDISKFETAATKLFQYWTVKPIILKDNKQYFLPYVKEEVLIQSAPNQSFSWNIVQISNYWSWNATPKVILDGVAYSISGDQFPKLNPEIHKFIFHNNFRITLPNGLLSLAASRDSLHMDDRTISALSDAFNKIVADFTQLAREKIEAATDYREACISLLEFVNNIKECHLNFDQLKWRDLTVYSKLRLSHFGIDTSATKYVKNDQGEIKGKGISARDYGSELYPESKENVYYYDDLEISNVRPYALEIFSQQDVEQVFILFTKDMTEEQKLLLLAIAEPLSSITLTASAKVKKTRRQAGEDKILAYYFDGLISKRHLVEVPLDSDAAYIVYDNGQLTDLQNKSLNFFSRFIPEIKRFCGKPIYAFTPTRARQLPANWQPLYNIINAKIKDFENKYDPEFIAQALTASDATLKEKYYYLHDKMSSVTNLGPLLQEYCDLSKKIDLCVEEAQDYLKMMQMLSLHKEYFNDNSEKTPYNKLLTKLEALDKRVQESYPLITLLNDYNVKAEHIEHYLNLIEV